MFDVVGGGGLVAEDEDGRVLSQILLHGVDKIFGPTHGRGPQEQLRDVRQHVVQLARVDLWTKK